MANCLFSFQLKDSGRRGHLAKQADIGLRSPSTIFRTGNHHPPGFSLIDETLRFRHHNLYQPSRHVFVMPENSVHIDGPTLEQFRQYLTVLADAHLDPKYHRRLGASDVVQQTLTEAYTNRQQFSGDRRQLAGWLRTILLNNLTDQVRALGAAKRDLYREQGIERAGKDSSVRGESWLAADHTSPSQHAIREEELLAMSAAIARLPEDQRQAVVLHHLSGWTLDDLAEKLGRSRSAVAGLLHRGLKAVRESMNH